MCIYDIQKEKRKNCGQVKGKNETGQADQPTWPDVAVARTKWRRSRRRNATTGGNRNAEEEEKQRCDCDGGARVHEEALEKTNGIADHRVVAAVETLLPIQPMRRRLVVSLNHFHLVDAFPQNDHVLVHQAPSSVVMVLP